jgi:hypothetical protein
MRQVLNTTDRSLAASLRISLESEGIDAVVSNDTVTTLPFLPITVAVLNDADYDRAVQLLHTFQVTPVAAGGRARLTPRFLGRLVLVVVLIFAIALVCMDLFF